MVLWSYVIVNFIVIGFYVYIIFLLLKIVELWRGDNLVENCIDILLL